MIEYSQKDIETAHIYMCRFSLLKMKNQCNEICSYWFTQDINKWIVWFDLRKEFDKLFDCYAEGVKVNEGLLIKLNDIKFDSYMNPLVVRRLIKLIFIV